MSARVALIIADVHVRFFSPFINLSGFTYLKCKFSSTMFHVFVLIAAAAKGRTGTTFFPCPRRSDLAFPCATVKGARARLTTRDRISVDSQYTRAISLSHGEKHAHIHQRAYIRSADIKFLIPWAYIVRNLGLLR